MAATEYVVPEMAGPRAEGIGHPAHPTAKQGGRVAADPMAEFTERVWKAWEFALHPPRIPVGLTPSDVVYTEDKMRVLRYRPLPGIKAEGRPPILLVYALINKPYILDLQPGLSVVESLLRRGLDVYLVDWGTPDRLDKDRRIHDYVNGYIDHAMDAVCRVSGVDRPHLLGYCMGGTFAAMYAMLHSDRMRTLSLMAAGLDFDTQAGFLNVWSRAPGFDPWKIARTFELIPPEFFVDAFGILDPLRNYYIKFKDLLHRMDEPAYVENFLRMEKWNNDGIPMAGPTYAEFIEKGYQKNLLVKGEWTLDGDTRRMDPTVLKMPVATIVGLKDNLMPPESTERFLKVVGSREVKRFELPSGHIGLSVSRSAHQVLWPAVGDWIMAHSEGMMTGSPHPTRRPRKRRVPSRKKGTP